MEHHIKDLEVTLDQGNEHNGDVPYSFIQILDAENVLRPNMLWRDKKVQWHIIGVVWSFVLFGSFFRLPLYSHFFEQYKKKEMTAANRLCLVLTLVQHLHVVLMVTNTTLIVGSETSLHEIPGGTWFCFFQMYLNDFSVGYCVIGSLGISIYRILLIKQNSWVKDCIGERILLNCILFGGISLTMILVLLLSSDDYKKLSLNTCMAVPNMLFLETLDEYEQSRGNSSPLSYFINVRISLGVILMSMMVGEISIYVIFYHHLYKHDNKEGLRRLLEPGVIKRRNRSTAITFFGQFCCFVMKLTILLIFLVALVQDGAHWNRGNVVMNVALTFWQFMFAIISMFEVLSSFFKFHRMCCGRNYWISKWLKTIITSINLLNTHVYASCISIMTFHNFGFFCAKYLSFIGSIQKCLIWRIIFEYAEYLTYMYSLS